MAVHNEAMAVIVGLQQLRWLRLNSTLVDDKGIESLLTLDENQFSMLWGFYLMGDGAWMGPHLERWNKRSNEYHYDSEHEIINGAKLARVTDGLTKTILVTE